MSGRLLLALAVLAALVFEAPGQPPAKSQGKEKGGAPESKQAPPKEGPKLPQSPFKSGILDVDAKDKLSQKNWSDFGQMVAGRRGGLDPTAPATKQLMDRAARWLAYRLTWPEIQDGRYANLSMGLIVDGDSRQGTVVERKMEDANDRNAGFDWNGALRAIPIIPTRPPTDPEELERRKNQALFLREFQPILTTHLMKVMENVQPIARVNAARILQGLAAAGQEPVADVLVDIIDRPYEIDAVKLYAVKGLGDLFALQAIKDPKRQERAMWAVYKWLDARTKIDKSVASQMSPEEKLAVSYIRRAAVRALGNTRRPLIVDVPDRGKERYEGPIAALLLRIMNNEEGTVQPEPTWSERAEAATALCQMQAKNHPKYQPEYTIFHLGRFLAALGTAANEDAMRSTDRWQHYASILKAGAEQMAADLKDGVGGKPQPASAYLGKLLVLVNPALENLFDSSKQTQATQELLQWVNREENKPKADGPYSVAVVDAK